MSKLIIGRRLLACISKNFYLVGGTTVSAVFAVWLMSVFVYEPEYMASSQVFVEPLASETAHEEALPSSDYQTLEAYQVLATSPAVLSRVIDSTESTYSIMELQERILIERPDNSRVFNISVSAADENEAAEIANAIAFSLQEEVKHFLKVDNVSVILKAGKSSNPLEESNSLGFLWLLAAVAGLGAGVLLSVLVEVMAVVGQRTASGRKKNPHLQTVFK